MDTALIITKRLVYSVPLMFGVVCISFLLIRLAPGDPITAMTGGYPVPAEFLAEIRTKYGLDQPLFVQFVNYLTNLLKGDLGYSYVNRMPVLDLILARLGPTLLLMATAMMVAAVVGIPLGVTSAVKRGNIMGGAVTIIALVGYAVPVFWLGQMLILIFSGWLGWLPSGGMNSLRGARFGIFDTWVHLLLPAATLSLRYVAINMRLTRTAMIEAMESDYILAARARGLNESKVVFKHGLRNALLPVVTIIGYNFGFALGGSVLVETVFAWPGIGRLLYTSIGARDYPVIMGLFLFMAFTIVIANLVTDIVYRLIDPRIRY